MLETLGKRIERLIYLGLIILLACAAEVYISTTVYYIRTSNPVGFSTLADAIEKDLPKLKDLFIDSARPAVTLDTSVDERIQETRRKLGLPPAVKKVIDSRKAETYQSAMNGLVTVASAQTGMERAVLMNFVDLSKSPTEIMEVIRSKQQELEKRAIVVWGIQSPVALPIVYGSAHYQIPNWVLSYLLMIAVIPLTIGWLGSLYFTRQRELFLIRNISDYKLSFPHILNILPMLATSLPIFQKQPLSQKRRHRVLSNAKINCALLRTLILVSLSVPMLFSALYSMGAQLIASNNDGIIWLILIVLTGIVMLSQIALLIFQEWAILWGKSFSA